MKEETKKWLDYADDNLKSAKILLESSLYNPVLQNIQQAAEKMLKAACVEFSFKFRKTHSINELADLLKNHNLDSGLTMDECDLFDSIYLPSKYPLASVLPDFEPDDKICRICLTTADKLRKRIDIILAEKI